MALVMSLLSGNWSSDTAAPKGAQPAKRPLTVMSPTLSAATQAWPEAQSMPERATAEAWLTTACGPSAAGWLTSTALPAASTATQNDCAQEMAVKNWLPSA